MLGNNLKDDVALERVLNYKKIENILSISVKAGLEILENDVVEINSKFGKDTEFVLKLLNYHDCKVKNISFLRAILLRINTVLRILSTWKRLYFINIEIFHRLLKVAGLLCDINLNIYREKLSSLGIFSLDFLSTTSCSTYNLENDYKTKLKEMEALRFNFIKSYLKKDDIETLKSLYAKVSRDQYRLTWQIY
jgi:hypothetical protein